MFILKAYFITSGVLVIVPPFIALSIANLYVFTPEYQQKKSFYEQSTDANSRPDLYIMNAIIGAVHVISWLPLCSLQVYETMKAPPGGVTGPYIAPAQLHFWLLWLAIANSFWKFPVYVVCFHDFRTGLRMLYANLGCCTSCC